MFPDLFSGSLGHKVPSLVWHRSEFVVPHRYRRDFSMLSSHAGIRSHNGSLKSGLSISRKKFLYYLFPEAYVFDQKETKSPRYLRDIRANIRDCFFLKRKAALKCVCSPAAWSGSVLRERPALPEALCTFTKSTLLILTSGLSRSSHPLASAFARAKSLAFTRLYPFTHIHTHMHFLTSPLRLY
jgi:hypothetical protein